MDANANEPIALQRTAQLLDVGKKRLERYFWGYAKNKGGKPITTVLDFEMILNS